MPTPDLLGCLDEFLDGHTRELIDFRRDLHAHPEIAHTERRTTAKVAPNELVRTMSVMLAHCDRGISCA